MSSDKIFFCSSSSTSVLGICFDYEILTSLVLLCRCVVSTSSRGFGCIRYLLAKFLNSKALVWTHLRGRPREASSVRTCRYFCRMVAAHVGRCVQMSIFVTISLLVEWMVHPISRSVVDHAIRGSVALSSGILRHTCIYDWLNLRECHLLVFGVPKVRTV